MTTPKIVLITGASKGIGQAIANKFASLEDHLVIACARNRPEPRALHERVDFVECDVGDKAQIQRLADYVQQKHGNVAVLVNNAGKFIPGRFQDELDDVFEELLRVNLSSAYYLTKRVLPGMLQQGRGTIFNICSTASITAYANGGSYAITKHALLGFSRCLREETKEQGIRVISVLPGATSTSSWEGSGVPDERLMPAEDIANIVYDAYKLSDRTVIEELLVRPILGDII